MTGGGPVRRGWLRESGGERKGAGRLGTSGPKEAQGIGGSAVRGRAGDGVGS